MMRSLDEAMGLVPEIAPAALAAALEGKDSPLVLDVRAAFEIEAGAIPGALTLEVAEVEARVEDVVADKSREVVVYCSGVSRAAVAGALMIDLGYERVRRLSPGFTAWRAEGLPTSRGAGAAWSERYARHLSLAEVGPSGQAKLESARVLVVGAGGLGSPAALYLAAAGVGTLGLADPDRVERSNLQRQILHTTGRIGRAKVSSARESIGALNPHVRVEPHEVRVTAETARALVERYDVVVDGTDNLATRYALSDVCVALERPLVFGAVHAFEGQVAVFGRRDEGGRWRGPCYRCMCPETGAASLAPSCAEIGVLGVLPGLVGTVQALEALKLLLGIGRSLTGAVLMIDGLSMRFTELALPRDPACSRCS